MPADAPAVLTPEELARRHEAAVVDALFTSGASHAAAVRELASALHYAQEAERWEGIAVDVAEAERDTRAERDAAVARAERAEADIHTLLIERNEAAGLLARLRVVLAEQQETVMVARECIRTGTEGPNHRLIVDIDDLLSLVPATETETESG